MEKRVNRELHESQKNLSKIDSELLLHLFPFGLILDKEMKIVGAGEKIIDAWSSNNNNRSGQAILGAPLTDHFKLCRPKGIAFNWDNVKNLQYVLFELELLRSKESAKGRKSIIQAGENVKSGDSKDNEEINITTNAILDRRGSQGMRSILLKGQMRYLKELEGIIFLCSPL